MVLPVVAYGNNILRKVCKEVTSEFSERDQLISDMWETLYATDGAGLAAPQVNYDLKIFMIDTKKVFEKLNKAERENYFSGDSGIKETFINATIREKSERLWLDYEGCLSIPGISEEVVRPWEITIEYFDINMRRKYRNFSGYTARVIQHEYDHVRGLLFLDHLSSLRRRILKSRLNEIASGKIRTKYEMISA